MHLPGTDTIAAISTPIGEGAIAVLRLSGPDSIFIADRIFQGKKPLSTAISHTVHYGRLKHPKAGELDDVLVTLFRAPNSYTAEDVVEISCHGSVYLARRILEILIESGARLAEPGEFTRRAFLNGRMDLTQAEAVADLIRSQSSASHTQALAQQRGQLSYTIQSIREQILETCSLVELDLDFTEEGLEIVTRQSVKERLEQIQKRLSQLIDSYELGKVVREGIRVTIVGEPNVGKSSILNALLREHRAIVTDISGTTRDTIEEDIQLDGLLCKITDTAGFRETDDLIELEGINRSRIQIRNSDLVLVVLDSLDASNTNRLDRFKMFLERELTGVQRIVVINKVDMIDTETRIALDLCFRTERSCKTSAKTGEGITDLEEMIYETSLNSQSLQPDRSLIVSNIRHMEKLTESRKWIDTAIKGIETSRSSELWAADLRTALVSLSEIIGIDLSDEMLNRIFSKFCIGK